MNKKFVSIGFIVAAGILGVCAWFLLPPVVAVQVGVDGQVSNTMPKAFAVLIPVGLSVVGSIMNMSTEQQNWKGFVISLAGIVVLVMELIFNL